MIRGLRPFTLRLFLFLFFFFSSASSQGSIEPDWDLWPVCSWLGRRAGIIRKVS